MSYVKNDELTLEYIQTLLHNGATHQSGLTTARDVLILQHVIQQNS